MATSVRCATLRPPAWKISFVADPKFQEILAGSKRLTHKVLFDITATHKSCINIESLQLNSDNRQLVIVARNIGIPPAPVLRPLSEPFPVESSLWKMSEGLQHFQALLTDVLPRMKHQEMTELLFDTRDLLAQIHKMLKLSQAELPPTPPTPTLRLPGEYEEQVAAHLSLVHLRGFCMDLLRSFQQLTGPSEDLDDS